MRITWVGHSTVVVAAGETRVITDPVLRGRVTHLRRVGVIRPDQVARIDAALITHLHYDHLDLPSLARLGRTTQLVVPAGAAPMLRRKGFTQIAQVDVDDEVVLGEITVRATFAAHGGNRPLFGAKASALGYVLESRSARAYFAGDTDLFAGMADLSPGLDVALLPIWGWGSKLGPGHLDPRRAAEALVLLQPRIAVPIHWGTYYPIRLWGGRPEFITRPVESFRRHAAELAPSVDVRILGLGDTLDVD